MFYYTLIEKKEVDLDCLVDTLKDNPVIVDTMNSQLGDLEYSFVVDCVEKQIEEIKKNTPMPLDD